MSFSRYSPLLGCRSERKKNQAKRAPQSKQTTTNKTSTQTPQNLRVCSQALVINRIKVFLILRKAIKTQFLSSDGLTTLLCQSEDNLIHFKIQQGNIFEELNSLQEIASIESFASLSRFPQPLDVYQSILQTKFQQLLVRPVPPPGISCSLVGNMRAVKSKEFLPWP